MKEELIASAEQRFNQRDVLRRSVLQEIETRVKQQCDSWLSEHHCGCTAAPTEVMTSVEYVGLLGCGTVGFPRITCGFCKETFTPSAIRAGCFNSSPVDPHAWYDMALLDEYLALALSDGLSMTGELTAGSGGVW